MRTVQETLAPTRPLAYTTVMTMLERLARKQLVGRRKTGRHFVYAAAVERDEIRKLAVQNLVDALFDASPQQLAAFLAGGPSLPPAADAQPKSEDEPGDSDFDAVLL